MIKTKGMWLSAVLLGIVACGGSDSTGPTAPEDVSFDPSLGIDLAQMIRLPEGVYIQTVVPGTGDEELTSSLNYSMDYQVFLPDGRKIDEGTIRSEFVPSLIEGWEIGVRGMKLAETRVMVLPSELAYGSNEVGAVPPNSVLVFQVTLVGMRP